MDRASHGDEKEPLLVAKEPNTKRYGTMACLGVTALLASAGLIYIVRTLLVPAPTPKGVLATVIKEYSQERDLLGNANQSIIKDIYEKYPGAWNFGDNGREFLDSIVKQGATHSLSQKENFVVMEVGVWLGESVARWANLDPNVFVVGVDPFNNPKATSEWVVKTGMPKTLLQHFGDGFDETFANYVVKELAGSNRHFFVKGFSPDAALPLLSRPGMKVNMFYIDGGKSEDTIWFTKYIDNSLRKFFEHNPDAVLSGDDWSYKATPTLQPTILSFAAEHGLQVGQSAGRSWAMAKDLLAVAGQAGAKFKFELRDPKTYHGPTVSEILAAEVSKKASAL